MLKESAFAKAVMQNEVCLKIILQEIYDTAQTILSKHPLYEYFEQYIGGVLIVMDPDGKILIPEEEDSLTTPQRVGYVHPLDRDRYFESAVRKAKRLINRNLISSYVDSSEEAGAIKIQEGIIFSFSGFEFLELKDKKDTNDYKDIFEIINLYTLLTYGFFDPNKQAPINSHRHNFEDDEDEDEYNMLREEIIFSLSNEELIEIASKIIDQGHQFNFGLLNEIFIAKVLLETGFIDTSFVEDVIKISNNRFATNGIFY